MARALVLFERQGTQWRPTIVFLGTQRKLDAQALPGDGNRDAFLTGLRQDATPPLRDDGSKGTWEDWIGWALGALANGHDLWATEVKPAITVQNLYEREILKIAPRPLTAPDVRPESVVPSDLHGYKKVRPA